MAVYLPDLEANVAPVFEFLLGVVLDSKRAKNIPIELTGGGGNCAMVTGFQRVNIQGQRSNKEAGPSFPTDCCQAR